MVVLVETSKLPSRSGEMVRIFRCPKLPFLAILCFLFVLVVISLGANVRQMTLTPISTRRLKPQADLHNRTPASVVVGRHHLDVIKSSKSLFANRTLKVCVVVREPFVIYKQEFAGGINNINNYRGVVIEIIRHMMSIYNFRVRVVQSPDNQFGAFNELEGTWTGLMGVLVRKEADLGATALSITLKRAEVVDFTRAYYVETASILQRIPKEEQNFLVIMQPFSLQVWLGLALVCVCLIVLVMVMTKLEDGQREAHRVHELAKILERRRKVTQRLARFEPQAQCLQGAHDHQQNGANAQQNPMNPQQNPLSPHQAVLVANQRRRLELLDERLRVSVGKQLVAIEAARNWHEFGVSWLERFYYSTSCVMNILLLKDIKHPPKQTPIRILVCVWWLSTIVVVNVYLGTLFELLVLPRRARALDTLEELVGQSEVAWCVTRGSALHDLLRLAPPGSVYGRLGALMQTVSNVHEGVDRVLSGKFAFIREQSMLRFKIATEHERIGECRLQMAREQFYSVGFGLALPKDSPLSGALDAALAVAIEAGLVAGWTQQYWPARSRLTECAAGSASLQPLGLKHFLSVYLLWLVLVGAALASLGYQWLARGLRNSISP